MDIAGKLRLAPGDFGGGAQAVVPVTDLSAHVDGGRSSSASTNAGSSADAQRNMYYAAGIVIGATVLLWLLGALVFRSIRL